LGQRLVTDTWDSRQTPLKAGDKVAIVVFKQNDLQDLTDGVRDERDRHQEYYERGLIPSPPLPDPSALPVPPINSKLHTFPVE